MTKQLKTIPVFATEDEEFEFWATADSTEYFDSSKDEVILEKNAFPNLKRSDTNVEVPLSPELFARVKARAKQEEVPFGMLLQRYIQEGIEGSIRKTARV